MLGLAREHGGRGRSPRNPRSDGRSQFLFGGGRYRHSEERHTTGLVALVLKKTWEVTFQGDPKERGHRDDQPDEVGLRLLTAADQAGSMRIAANPKGRRP